jgi:alkaline phosphatase D
MVEAHEHNFPKDHPLRGLFLGQGPADDRPQPTVNLLLRHGVRSCLEYARSGDIAKARALSNPDLSPHVSFVDMGGHGYSVVRVTSESLETEFVCIPRPLERSDRKDGGPLNYRVRSRTVLWEKGETPRLDVQVLDGDPRFSL